MRMAQDFEVGVINKLFEELAAADLGHGDSLAEAQLGEANEHLHRWRAGPPVRCARRWSREASQATGDDAQTSVHGPGV